MAQLAALQGLSEEQLLRSRGGAGHPFTPFDRPPNVAEEKQVSCP
jgi:hypothetical protein